MSDIVSWLRNSAIVRSDDPALSGRYTEAADEIERLQAALALSQSQNYCTLCGALNPDKNSRALEEKI